MFDEEIAEKHPELMELREFKTDKEIITAFKKGGTMWEVGTLYSQPNRLEVPIKVLKVKKYRGLEVVISAVPGFPNEEHFVSDMQNHPAKAVFTSKMRAKKFFRAAKKAFAENQEWQKQSELEAKQSNDRIIDW